MDKQIKLLLTHIIDCLESEDAGELAKAVSDAKNLIAGNSFVSQSSVLRTSKRSFFAENVVLRAGAKKNKKDFDKLSGDLVDAISERDEARDERDEAIEALEQGDPGGSE
jgi:hypothetical protein